MINLNDMVTVVIYPSTIKKLKEEEEKLTGREVTKEQILKWNGIKVKSEDSYGYTEYETTKALWQVMKLFGHMFQGSYSPIGTLIKVEE